MNIARTRIRRLTGKHLPWPEVLDDRCRQVLSLLDTHPRRVQVWFAVVATVVAGLAGGPVAAGVAGIYCAVAVAAVTRYRSHALLRAGRDQTRHVITLLAADLRAGADPATAVPATVSQLPELADAVCRRARDQLDAAVRIAETVGAPISRLLDQLAADLRVEAKVEAILATHTAGTVASARLLAALPAAGLGLGQAMGTDPLATLLYTPVGAACTVVAVALQLGGLLWSRRIVASVAGGVTA